MDAETCALDKALAYRSVELRENARLERLLMAPDGKRITGAEVSIAGERKTITAAIVILAAGAVNSAALLLTSSEKGVANRSGAVGRHFMITIAR
jgi:choline dehydrogenase-like flavoprotein